MKRRPRDSSLQRRLRRKLEMRDVLFASLLATLALGFGSSCKRATNKPVPASSASATPDKIPPNVDVDLWGQLASIAKTCKVDEQRGTVTCTQGEQRKLISEFSSNQRSRIKALPTFTAALSAKNPGLQTVAANLLYTAFRTSFGPDVKPGDVSAKDANELLAATVALPKAQTRQALPAAVHAAMLANQSEALYAAMDKLNDVPLRAVAVRNLMTYGRLNALKKVQELAKDDKANLAAAALESPPGMLNWTEAEQAQICPWAMELLADTRPLIAAKAASLIGSCSGEFIDKLLDAGERALADKKFSSAELSGYRDLCAANRRGRPSAASEQQCARSRKLLEKVAESKNVEVQTRGMALGSLAHQWPDERTLLLAKRLEKGSDTTLAESARRTIQRLEQRKTGGPGVASGAPRPRPPAPRPPGAAVNPAAPQAPSPAAPQAPSPDAPPSDLR
jgi:hypothetical protein